MDLYSKIEGASSKTDFIEILTLLKKDFIENKEMWENRTVDEYLDAIISWIEDYSGQDVNFEHPDWKTIAALFYMGKIYE